jgi:hypothetical protein
MARAVHGILNHFTSVASAAVLVLLSGCTGRAGEPPAPARSPVRPEAIRPATAPPAFSQGPCFDPSARITCENDADKLPDALQGIMDAVDALSGIYSKVMTAEDIIQKVGEALDLIKHQPKGDELIGELKRHLDQTARGVEWLIDAQFAANRYANEYGALLDAKQARDRGQPFDTTSPAWNDSFNAVIGAGNKDIFRRTYSDDSVTGRWMQVVDERAQVDSNGLSYDWRLGLSAYMQLIALRLQVIAVIDPNFRNEVIPGSGTVSPLIGEFTEMRNTLLTHYALIKDGIQCGRRQLGGGGPGDPFVSACADVNTGIEVVSDAGVDVNSLQTRLETRLPLFEIKALVNSLAMYTDTSFRDLTGPTAQIRNDLDFRCLQATVLADGTSLASPAGCDQPRTSWSYDRDNSVIRGGHTFTHCLAGDASEGSLVGTALADTTCALGQPGGHWTYDPIGHTLMNGWGYFLSWGSFQSCDDFTGECTTVDIAVNSRNPGQWGSQP